MGPILHDAAFSLARRKEDKHIGRPKGSKNKVRVKTGKLKGVEIETRGQYIKRLLGEDKPKRAYVRKTPVPAKEMTLEELEARFEALKQEGLKVDEERLNAMLQLKAVEDANKINYFVPFPHQRQFLDYIVQGKKTVMLVGANQIGKTVVCVNTAGGFSLGCKELWSKDDNKPPFFPSDFARENNGKKVIGRILCNDWEKAARDTIVPKLKEWLPQGSYETKKNNVGVEHEFYFPATGSKFTILTYKEDTKSHEGWTGDWVHADEPPPRDKYIANRRGLIAHNGIFTFAMTAIDEPWILDDLVLNQDVSTGIVADVPIEANTSLTPEAIRIFEKDLTEDEKIARIKGGWMQLSGRIWKCFNPAIHVIEPRTIMSHWPCEFQIDFHLNLPHAISFAACDEYNRYIIFKEVWANCSNAELADHIIKTKKEMNLRMRYGEIDALSKGDTAYIKNRFGRDAEDSFTEIGNYLRKNGQGLTLGVGSKDEKSYIKAVEARLKGTNGPVPTLYIFNTCKETIKQVSRWSYDEHGVPKDDGHFPECIGRFTQTGLKYTQPTWERTPIDYRQVSRGIV